MSNKEGEIPTHLNNTKEEQTLTEPQTTESEVVGSTKDSLDLDTLKVESEVKNEIEIVAKQELEKVNVTRIVLDRLSKYKELKLSSPTDVEGYKQIVQAKREVVNVRNMAVKICTMKRAKPIAEQRAWLAKQKEIVNELSPTEISLDAEIEIYKNEQDRIEREENERKEKLINDRIQALLVFNPMFDGNSYRFKERTTDMTLLKLWNDDQYNEFYNLVKDKHEADIKEAEQAEERAKAEAKRLQEEREKQEAEAKRLRDEADKLAREKEEMRKEKVQARSNELVVLGLQYAPREDVYALGTTIVTGKDINELDNANWNNLLIEIKPKIQLFKTELARLLEEKRQSDLKRAADEAAAKAKFDAEAKAKEEIQIAEAKAKAEAEVEKAKVEQKILEEAKAKRQMEAERFIGRKQVLLDLGFDYRENREYQFVLDGVWSCFQEQIEQPDDKQFYSYLDAVKDAISKHKQRLAEIAQAEAEKKAQEEKLKAEREAKEKLEAEIKAKEEARIQAEIKDKEAKRKAALAPDKEKLIKLSKQIETLEVPEFTSLEGKEAGLKVKEQVAKMASWILGVANKME